MGMGRGLGGQNIKVMKITCLRNQHVSTQRKAAAGLHAYVRLPPYLRDLLSWTAEHNLNKETFPRLLTLIVGKFNLWVTVST